MLFDATMIFFLIKQKKLLKWVVALGLIILAKWVRGIFKSIYYFAAPIFIYNISV